MLALSPVVAAQQKRRAESSRFKDGFGGGTTGDGGGGGGGEEDGEDEGDAADEAMSSTGEDKNGVKQKPKPRLYYVYLMACSVVMPDGQRRNHTHIGKSRNAVRKVRLHNEGRVNSGKRSTRTSAPYWRLEQWVGPFESRNEARDFQRLWFRNTKGIKLRIEKGVELARAHSLRCYTPRALLGGGGLKHSDNSVTLDPPSDCSSTSSSEEFRL